MSTASKTFAIVALFGIAIGLVALNQPGSEHPILVSVTTSPQGAKHEQKIALKAAVNGRGLSHGEVRLNFIPTDAKNWDSSSSNWPSVKGYTDTEGVFISAGPQFPAGEYMITALVSKTGCADGKSVCFLRVPESRQDLRILKAPISISSSNRPGG
jgi:hypothetical protein